MDNNQDAVGTWPDPGLQSKIEEVREELLSVARVAIGLFRETQHATYLSAAAEAFRAATNQPK